MKQENIDILRNASGTAASEMTHGLRVLGDGDMGTGLCNFWDNGYETGYSDGEKDGVLRTVVVSIVIYGICGLVEFGIQKMRKAKKVRLLRAARSANTADREREARDMQYAAAAEYLDHINFDTILQMQDDMYFAVKEMEEL